MEETGMSHSQKSSHVYLLAYTKLHYTYLKVPNGYPELENPLDVRIPLHFLSEKGVNMFPISGSLGPEIAAVWDKIGAELRRLLVHYGIGYHSLGYYAMTEEDEDDDEEEGKKEETKGNDDRESGDEYPCYILDRFEEEV